MTAIPSRAPTGQFAPKAQLVPGKARTRQPDWTPEETAILKRMVEAGTPRATIAMALGRTEGSVTQKASKLGYFTTKEPGRVIVRAEYGMPRILQEWPKDAPPFEDHPKAPAWEPRWRIPAMPVLSPFGSAAAMCADGGSAKTRGLRAW